MRILAVLVVMLAVVHAPASAARAQEHTKTTRLALLEASIVSELNRVRAARGLQPLKRTPRLGSAARSHSKSMLDLGFFGHDSPDGTAFSDRIKQFYPSQGWSSWSVGEALMTSPGRQAAPSAIVRAWLGSPPHRQIVLARSWRDVGIGAFYSPLAPQSFGNAEAIVVTADFGLRR